MRAGVSMVDQVERDGFAVVEDVIEDASLDALVESLSQAPINKTRGENRRGYGMRNLLAQIPETRALVTHPGIASLVEEVLGSGAFAVRAILFDKLEGANWHVGWHQDQAIAIRGRADAPGFGPTSVKDGVAHTRASAEVLQNMLAVRLHLDDCDEDNGPLRCVPGSHKLGRLDPEDSLPEKERLGERVCTARRGGVLLMRPLCLHASSPAQSPRHRRVIHIEFANCELPEPLDWYERYPVQPT